MTDRCEPPLEWRDKDGWHWIEGPYSTGPLLWMRQGFWRRPGNTDMTPEEISAIGCVYLRPCHSPEVLERVEEVLSDLVDGIATGHIRYRHGPKLRSALAALAALRGTP